MTDEELEFIIDEECEHVLKGLTPEQKSTLKDLLNNCSKVYAINYLTEQAKCGSKTACIACDYIKDGKITI